MTLLATAELVLQLGQQNCNHLSASSDSASIPVCMLEADRRCIVQHSQFPSLNSSPPEVTVTPPICTSRFVVSHHCWWHCSEKVFCASTPNSENATNGWSYTTLSCMCLCKSRHDVVQFEIEKRQQLTFDFGCSWFRMHLKHSLSCLQTMMAIAS